MELCRENQRQRRQAYHTTEQPGKTAARLAPADRATTTGGAALDPEAGRYLAETAVHGDAAGAARQHEGFHHLERLRHGTGGSAGRPRRRPLLYSHGG